MKYFRVLKITKVKYSKNIGSKTSNIGRSDMTIFLNVDKLKSEICFCFTFFGGGGVKKLTFERFLKIILVDLRKSFKKSFDMWYVRLSFGRLTVCHLYARSKILILLLNSCFKTEIIKFPWNWMCDFVKIFKFSHVLGLTCVHLTEHVK